MKIGRVLLLMSTLLPGAASASFAAGSSPGMLASVTGTVEMKPQGAKGAGWARPAAMALMQRGAVIRTAKGASATLLFFADGHREKMLPETTATVQPSGLQPSAGARRVPVASSTPPKEPSAACVFVFRGSGRLAGGQPVSAGRYGAVGVRSEITLRAPLPGVERDTRPTFAWEPSPSATGYAVELAETGGKLGTRRRRLWTRTVQDARLPYPAGEDPLVRGASYVWSLAALQGAGQRSEGLEVKFAVLDANTLGRLQREEASLRPLTQDAKELAGPVCLGRLYASHQMLREAIEQFERADRLDPENPEVHKALAILYKRAGWGGAGDGAQLSDEQLIKRFKHAP